MSDLEGWVDDYESPQVEQKALEASDFSDRDTEDDWIAELYTPQEMDDLKAKGKIGWTEAAGRQDILELIPYINALSLKEEAGLLWDMWNLEADDFDNEQDREKALENVKRYARVLAEEIIRGRTWGAEAYLIASQIPAVGVEFFSSAGLYTAGKTAGKKALVEGSQAFFKQSLRKILRSNKVLRKVLPATIKLGGAVAGSVNRLKYQPHRLAGSLAKEVIENKLQITTDGQVYLTEASDSPAKMVFDATAGQIIENLSEVTGAKILLPFAKPANRLIAPLAKRAAPGLKQVSGKTGELVRQSVQKMGVSEDFVNKATEFIVKEIGDKKLKTILETAGWNGVLGEMTEERLADFLRIYTGIDDREGVSFFEKNIEALGLDWRRVSTEAFVFSAFGAGSVTTRALYKKLNERGYTKPELDLLYGKLDEEGKKEILDEYGSLDVARKILTSKPPKEQSLFRKLYAEVSNEQDAIEQVTRSAQEFKNIKPGENPKLLARSFYGLSESIQSVLEDATYRIRENGEIEKTGEGLQPILDSMQEQLIGIESNRDAQEQDIEKYSIAKRYLEDLKQQEDVKVTDKQMENSIKDLMDIELKYGQDTTKVDEIHKRLVGFRHRVLGMLADSGVLSKKDLETYITRDKNYVSFSRVFEDFEDVSPNQKPIPGFTKAKSPIKKIKGSEREIENTLHSTIRGTIQVMERAAKNRVAKSVANLADVLPDRIRKVPAKAVPTKEGVKRVGEPDGNIIEYYEDGKKKFMEVDLDLYKSMASMNPAELQLFWKIVRFPFQTIAKGLRVGATMVPGFMASNLIRDQYIATIQTKVGFRPFIDSAFGIAHILRKTDMYYDWIRSGAAMSGIIDTDRGGLERIVNEFKNKKSLLRRLNIITSMRDLSDVIEKSTRIGVYQAAKRKGLSDIEAGFISRESTLDFSRKGSALKYANQVTAFLNAGIQGFDKTIRTFKENPVGASLKGAAYLTIPSIIQFLLYKDDEWYQELQPWEKNLFWHWNIGGQRFAIPKPFGIGQVFATIPERFMEYVYTNDPSAFDGMTRNLFESFSPVQSIDSMLPTAFVPLIENQANYNFWRDSELVPSYKLDLDPHMQFNKNTSETAKSLGKALEYSPAKIDNIVRSYLGTSGKYALQTSDTIVNEIKRSAGEEVYDKPFDYRDLPLVSRFVKKEPYGNRSASVQRFYDLNEELQAKKLTASTKERNNSPDYEDYAKGHRYQIEMADHFKDISREIRELNQEIDQIVHSDEDDEYKRKAILESEKIMTEVAREALDEYENGKP